MATTWIVAADSSRARVLQVLVREQKLQEIQSMVNPQGRMRDRDLQADGAPRWSGHGGMGAPGAASTSGPGSDREEQGPAQHAVELFAKEIGRFLVQARNEHRYDELVLVAPPRFLGALRGELGKEVERLVTEDLPKNLSWLSERELEGYFAASEGRSSRGSEPGR